MSDADWKLIVGTAPAVSPEAIGLTIVGGEFRSGSASSVRLRASLDCDAAEIMPYESAVTVVRNGSAFFRGKVRSVPKSASVSDEAHEYIVEDAWAELERTTYQEEWAAGVSSLLLPFAVLGVDKNGTRIDVGQQITEIINFAAANDVDIAAGSIPAGMNLWPSQVTGITCAEAIRMCLRYHPDWMPWIDHTTATPTFNVTPRSDAGAINLPLTECRGMNITEASDRLPDCVRLVFLTATVIDGEVYRDGSIQKWPEDGADAGPGTLTTVIELAGGQMQIQKQQVQTRTIPVDDDFTTAADYLLEKFPQLQDIPKSHFEVTAWKTKALVEDEDKLPDPINPEAHRLTKTVKDDLPRELARGTVHEWMRKNVGRIRVEMAVNILEDATEAEKKLLKQLPKAFTITATDATTKIYKGLSQWSPPEVAPAGIAQKYYETIVGGCRFSGSGTVGGDAGDYNFPGHKLNITGGLAAWATMDAPIHSVSWDLETGNSTVSFGPNADYSPQDFVEYLRLLAARPVHWWSKDERESNKLGAEKKPSAKGDTCTSFDRPETLWEFSGGSGSGDQCPFGEIIDTTDSPPGKAIRGGLFVCGDKNFNVPDQVLSLGTDGDWLVQIKLTGVTPAHDDDSEIFLPGVTTATGTPEWDNKTNSEGTQYDDNTNPANPGATGTLVVPIGRLVITDGVATLANTGCGTITAGQCAGILNFTRG